MHAYFSKSSFIFLPRLSEIDESPLEANQNISLKENDTFTFNESIFEAVVITRIMSHDRGLNDLESSVLIGRSSFDTAIEQSLPLYIAGTRNAVFCREHADISKIILPERFNGVKRIFNLDNFM